MEELYMNMETIITIGREYGSGGREIGRKLAQELGITFYDKNLLARAAKESGFCKELFEKQDEKPTNSFLYSLVMDTYSFGYSSAAFSDMPLNHKVFLAQFDTIKKIADEGPCVIVGRCADYALEEYSNCIHVFIHANMNTKIRRIAAKHDLTDAKAKELIHKTDKKRASYYNYYTNKKWGECKEYDLSINSTVLGTEGSIEIIKNFIELHQNARYK
jgi:cytidylate kinase